MSQIKKISVVGAGAVGTMVGGLIKRHRPDLQIVLIARGEHCQAMQERGRVELRGPWGCYEVPITASSDPADIIGSDLVLFTVKTQDTAETAKQISNLVGEAIVVSLQNGINQRVLSQFIRRDRLLVGMTATNMTTIQPGVVSLHRNGVSVIGAAAPDVPPEAIDLARQTLAVSGLKFEISDQILGVQYNKLLLNTMGYASVLSASDFIREGLLNGPWRKSVAIPLLSEGMSVLQAAGIPLQRVSGGSDVIRFRRLLQVLNTPGLDHVVRALIGLFNPPRIIFSVYHDLIRRRPTEIDFVNGEITRLAEECGLEAPYNAEVVRTVHALESSGCKEFLSRDEVVRRFRQL